MELNTIIELYRMLAENPDGFKLVMRNFYGGELLRLRDLIFETTSFVDSESGVDVGRNRYIEEELTELSRELNAAIRTSSYFRFVSLSNQELTSLSCEDIRIELVAAVTWIARNVEKFHAATRGYQNRTKDRTQHTEAFLKEKENILIMLHRINDILEKMEQKLV